MDYGINGKSPAYSVSGIYTPADGSGARFALLVFRDGELNEVWGFTGMTDTGPMSEIGPEQGDQFTVLEQGINPKEKATSEDWSREGDTLTFGEQDFVSEEVPAPSGEYVVGFIAEDLDGNLYDQYETVTVEN